MSFPIKNNCFIKDFLIYRKNDYPSNFSKKSLEIFKDLTTHSKNNKLEYFAYQVNINIYQMQQIRNSLICQSDRQAIFYTSIGFISYIATALAITGIVAIALTITIPDVNQELIIYLRDCALFNIVIAISALPLGTTSLYQVDFYKRFQLLKLNQNLNANHNSIKLHLEKHACSLRKSLISKLAQIGIEKSLNNKEYKTTLNMLVELDGLYFHYFSKSICY